MIKEQLEQQFKKLRNLALNQSYAIPAKSYITQLHPEQEAQFQSWVSQHQVPFDPSGTADYDMRGFYQALQNGDPRATNAINPNDGQLHYPDTWKTPYHQTFSNESQWATPNAPAWNEQDQLVLPDGRIVYDERVVNGK